MQRNTPLRNSNTCTPDFLTWPESSPPVSASSNRSRQPSDKMGEVLRDRQLAEDERRSLAKRKPSSGYRMKEMIEGGIFSDNAEDTASDANSAYSKNRTGIRVYQQAMSGISQISFNTEESISPKKLISIPEEAKQRELGGTLQNEPEAKSRKQMSSAKTSDLGGTSQNEPEAESRKQMSSAKTKELSGTDIFSPPTEIVPHSFTAACTLESEENKDLGEHVPRHLHTSVKVSNPAGGQSNILFGEEPVKTSKKMHDQKFAEMTGNNIFKGDVPPGSAEKHLSTARHREMAGSDIFADGKAENRDHILGARRQMAGSDIFSDGKAENRDRILGARRPPGGGSSIILD